MLLLLTNETIEFQRDHEYEYEHEHEHEYKHKTCGDD